MKMTQSELEKAFGQRLVTLNSGQQGLRAQVPITRLVGDQVKSRVTQLGGRNVHYFRASDATLDRYDEVIEPKGWDVSDFRKNDVILDSHRYGSIFFVLGNGPIVEVTEEALVIGIVFSQANPVAKVAEAMVEEDTVKSGSVGFMPNEWVDAANKESWRRRFTKQSLLEFSLTAIPANPNALKLSLDNGRITTGDLKDTVEFLKQFCSTKAEADPNPSARGTAVNDAQVLLLARDVKRLLRA